MLGRIGTEIFISAGKYLLRVSPDAERVQKVPVDDNCTDYVAKMQTLR